MTALLDTDTPSLSRREERMERNVLLSACDDISPERCCLSLLRSAQLLPEHVPKLMASPPYSDLPYACVTMTTVPSSFILLREGEMLCQFFSGEKRHARPIANAADASVTICTVYLLTPTKPRQGCLLDSEE